MFSFKQITGKRVVSKDGQALGRAQDVRQIKDAATCCIVTEKGEFTAEGVSVKKNYVVLRNPTEHNGGITVYGKDVYDCKGKRLGKVDDIFIGATAKLVSVSLDNGEEVLRGRISGISDVMIVKLAKTKKIPKQRAKEAKTNHSTVRAKTTPNYPVKRKYGDFSFLLGKTVDKTIINFYGEVMLRVGDKITRDALKQAKLSGKLIELCLHAK